MRIPTFRFSVISGSFSRIGAGATPFLLPMMLQLGFGYTAAQSGMVTFAGSVGSLLMRLVAPRLIREIGFRNVMTWIGLLATVLLAACAGLRPSWPSVAVYGLLLTFGFFQSLMFMAYNTIAYADVPRDGHQRGDQLLQHDPADGAVARHCFLGGDPGRLGGDEWAWAADERRFHGGFSRHWCGRDGGTSHLQRARPTCRSGDERPAGGVGRLERSETPRHLSFPREAGIQAAAAGFPLSRECRRAAVTGSRRE